MNSDLTQAAQEIFQYKELLKEVINASMNKPDVYLDKVFTIYEEMVELVNSFESFTLRDVEDFLSEELSKYDQQPFFPVIAGLYITALLNKLFQRRDYIELDLNELCYSIIDDATATATTYEKSTAADEVSFSLDFLGYLLPENKILKIVGPVGDFAGALMGPNSVLILEGIHGKNLGYGKDETARIVFNES